MEKKDGVHTAANVYDVSIQYYRDKSLNLFSVKPLGLFDLLGLYNISVSKI